MHNSNVNLLENLDYLVNVTEKIRLIEGFLWSLWNWQVVSALISRTTGCRRRALIWLMIRATSVPSEWWPSSFPLPISISSLKAHGDFWLAQGRRVSNNSVCMYRIDTLERRALTSHKPFLGRGVRGHARKLGIKNGEPMTSHSAARYDIRQEGVVSIRAVWYHHHS